MAYKNKIQGWMHDCEVDFLFRAVGGLEPGSLVVEVGCWKGRGSHAIASGAKGLMDLHFVDTFAGAETNPAQKKAAIKEDILQAFKNNMDGFNKTIHVKDSALAAKDFKDKAIDFLFLDANHDYKYVLKDVNAWLPKIKKGGIFCGHDYKDGYKGVKQAVDEMFVDKKINLYPDSIWSVRL